jgi:hypothetical protein
MISSSDTHGAVRVCYGQDESRCSYEVIPQFTQVSAALKMEGLPSDSNAVWNDETGRSQREVNANE